jgi:hypothetical protein
MRRTLIDGVRGVFPQHLKADVGPGGLLRKFGEGSLSPPFSPGSKKEVFSARTVLRYLRISLYLDACVISLNKAIEANRIYWRLFMKG